MDDLRPAFGARIKQLRTELNLSQEALADRAGVLGHISVTSNEASNPPPLDLVNRLTRGLDVTLAENESGQAWGEAVTGTRVIPME